MNKSIGALELAATSVCKNTNEKKNYNKKYSSNKTSTTPVGVIRATW